MDLAHGPSDRRAARPVGRYAFPREPSGPSRRLRPVAILALIVGAAPLALLLFYPSQTAMYIPASVVWFVTFAVVASLGATDPVDKTHPLLWGSAAMFVMYSLHPFAVISGGDLDQIYQNRFFRGSTYSAAIWLGACAIISLVVGYVVGSLLQRDRGLLHRATSGTSTIGRDYAGLARRLGYLSLTLAVVGYAAFAISTGQNVIDSVLAGARRGDVYSSSAYLYLAPQLLGPAAALLCYANHYQARRQTVVIVLIALQVVLFVPTGQRFVLLTSLTPVLMLWVYLKKTRLRMSAFIPLLIVSVFFILVLRDAGADSGTTLEESASHVLEQPVEGIRTFATGADTEMVDGLAIELQYVPAIIDYSHLSTVTNTLAAPIPSALWPGKPVTADSILNFRLLGVQRNNASVAYGFVGELYYDSGIWGVCIGFALLGYACRILVGLRDAARSSTAMLVYFGAVPLVVALARGSLALIAGRSLFTVGPLILFWIIVRHRSRNEIVNIVDDRHPG